MGLTTAEVQQRVTAGLTNDYRPPTSRSVASIFRANIFTLFNGILTTALVLVLIFGSPKDALFGFVLVFNALTGIVSELRAKYTLDKLAILNTADVTVIRDGKRTAMSPLKLVQDDVIIVSAGDQVPADGVIVDTARVQMDESILTGESQPQYKAVGDEVLSGASVISGQASVKLTTVGEQSYANRMSQRVRQFEMAHSELEDGINVVLRLIIFALPFILAALTAAQIHDFGGVEVVIEQRIWSRVIVSSVAGVIAMIPQGLVLLTSINFATAAIYLAKTHKVLVQELPAVEVLARVNTLCLDKTGTITSGEITVIGCATPEVAQLNPIDHITDQKDISALKLMVSDRANATARAIDDRLDDVTPLDHPPVVVPFSSVRKWSLVSDGTSTWVFGAPDVITHDEDVIATVEHFASHGMRVTLLARGKGGYTVDEDNIVLPNNLRPCVLVVLAEEVRPDAPQTLEYLKQQGIDVKVISGDNPSTVSAIAQRAGLRDDPVACDASTLDEGDITAQLMSDTDVFGRVTPEQKKAMVNALQDDGKTVAMTGDGINDALALKEADLGIAMGSGAQATKAAAKVVLLESNFSALPPVLAQGRRVLGNMERVSTLFFTKTVYAIVTALMIAVTVSQYPYLPRHLTMIGSLTIGIPAFFLALAPSNRRYRPGFLRRSMSLAVPAGIIASVTSLWAYWRIDGDRTLESTAATMALCAIALLILAILSRPLLSWRGILLLIMAGSVVVTGTFGPLRRFFALAPVSWDLIITIAISGGVGAIFVFALGFWWTNKYYPPVGSRAERQGE